VASENAVREARGESAFIVRAGLIVGPGDGSDRFGYWPAKLSGNGQVVVPDVMDQPTQQIDVRDLASWIVTGAERGLGGTFDARGSPRRRRPKYSIGSWPERSSAARSAIVCMLPMAEA
jgi:2'-hydroxyisoflavone reductase